LGSEAAKDIAVIDERVKIYMTMVHGEVVYQAQG